ncbi:MAG: hypothetical protein ABI852_09255, partial [Gemmatimonadaceae bacterium]
MNELPVHSRPTPREVLRHYWRVAGVRPWHLVLPAVLVLVAGAFEAGSFALLLQLTKAVGQNTFGFFADSRAFGWISRLVPESSASRNAILTVITVGLIILGRAGKFLFEYLRNLYIVPRTEGYRVAVGTETFSRVLGFGRQYFERQSIGHSDAE